MGRASVWRASLDSAHLSVVFFSLHSVPLAPFAAACWTNCTAPFFWPPEGGVNKRLRQIQLAARQTIFGQAAQDLDQRAHTHPLWEAAMAGLVRRKLVARQF